MKYEEYLSIRRLNKDRLDAVEAELAAANDQKTKADENYKKALLGDGGNLTVAEKARQDAFRQAQMMEEKLSLTQQAIYDRNKAEALKFHESFNDEVATPYAKKIKDIELQMTPLRAQLQAMEQEKGAIMEEYRSIWIKYENAPVQYGIEKSVQISSENRKYLK